MTDLEEMLELLAHEAESVELVVGILQAIKLGELANCHDDDLRFTQIEVRRPDLTVYLHPRWAKIVRHRSGDEQADELARKVRPLAIRNRRWWAIPRSRQFLAGWLGIAFFAFVTAATYLWPANLPHLSSAFWVSTLFVGMSVALAYFMGSTQLIFKPRAQAREDRAKQRRESRLLALSLTATAALTAWQVFGAAA